MTPDALRAIIVVGPELIAAAALAQLAAAHETARTLIDWTWPKDYA